MSRKVRTPGRPVAEHGCPALVAVGLSHHVPRSRCASAWRWTSAEPVHSWPSCVRPVRLDGIARLDLEDLRRTAEASRAGRALEARLAEAIVAAEAARFVARTRRAPVAAAA